MTKTSTPAGCVAQATLPALRSRQRRRLRRIPPDQQNASRVRRVAQQGYRPEPTGHQFARPWRRQILNGLQQHLMRSALFKVLCRMHQESEPPHARPSRPTRRARSRACAHRSAQPQARGRHRRGGGHPSPRSTCSQHGRDLPRASKDCSRPSPLSSSTEPRCPLGARLCSCPFRSPPACPTGLIADFSAIVVECSTRMAAGNIQKVFSGVRPSRICPTVS